jgi:DNA polymerase elongation subunit (family B)
MDFYTNVIQWGNQLFVRGVDNGQRVNKKVRYEPTLFDLVSQPTGYKTLDGKHVKPNKFDSITQAKDWYDLHKSQGIVFGNTQYNYCWIGDNFRDDVPWDKDQICIVTIDIEVECENGFPNPKDAAEPMLSITLKNHQNKKIIVWGLHEFQNDRDDVDYRLCNSEEDLLFKFIDAWSSIQPDVITGWYTEFFDIPYLCNRIAKVLGDDMVNKLSPWGRVHKREVFQMGRNHQIYNIYGIAALDYVDLYRKFTYTNQERYTLDHIASVELGESKDGNPYDTFKEWYQKDYQSFIEYNIQDVELVDKLEDKMRLIELCLMLVKLTLQMFWAQFAIGI